MCQPAWRRLILVGLNPAGLNVRWENSSSFWTVSRWYQSVDLRKVAKHWIVSRIASLSTRAFICTLDQKSCSSFTGVFCRDPSFFPKTEELGHCDQKGGFQSASRVSNPSRRPTRTIQNHVLSDVTLPGRCWQVHIGMQLDIILVPGYNDNLEPPSNWNPG